MGKEALQTKEEMQAIARKNAAARIKKVGVCCHCHCCMWWCRAYLPAVRARPLLSLCVCG